MGTTSEAAQGILVKARHLIETVNFIEAINLCDQAFVGFVEDKNYAGAVHALAEQVNAWRHLYNYSKARWNDIGEVIYVIRCRNAAQSMKGIFDQHQIDEQVHLVNYRYAVQFILNGEWVYAAKWIEAAIRQLPSDCSAAQRGDWLVHYGEALWKGQMNDEAMGAGFIKDGLTMIEQSRDQVDPYVFDVWYSKAHMAMAEYEFHHGGFGPSGSSPNLQIAADIISRNPKLLIRKRELKFLLQQFGYPDQS